MTENDDLFDSYKALWESGNRRGTHQVALEDVQELLTRFGSGFGPFSYVVQDYSSADFLYVGDCIEQVLGYPAELMYEMGARFFLEKLLIKEHSKLHFKLSKAAWEYVHQMPPHQMLMTSANFDHISRKKSGELARTLTRQIVVRLDDDQKIWLCLALFTDISHLKTPDINDPPQVSMFIPKTNDMLVYNSASESMINLDILTNREREISQLYAAGKSSGEIADELFISVYTVQTHRTHLLEKTGCKNLAELIHFSKCHMIGY
ncbi:helix-turn-helix transcriptional regulator [Aliifodinibius sp. S!AR15-10]|uniref:response regulator transcription factor n=1 Tax=Aliifodinibius sp. S!AR15-10 TaxID=2950437 RepID=UPI002854A300|nr:helix-turn-helix transcriptional regulator [Aliifodinibius sp. S!AR15-10]MDR8391982.1 helix-turn-helix transcriptional regulator [Aliifodinibius sp. S!AR15-10]